MVVPLQDDYRAYKRFTKQLCLLTVQQKAHETKESIIRTSKAVDSGQELFVLLKTQKCFVLSVRLKSN